MPNKQLGFVRCSIDTVKGKLESNWYYNGDTVNFEINIPEGTIADIVLPNGYFETIKEGKHVYSCRKLLY